MVLMHYHYLAQLTPSFEKTDFVKILLRWQVPHEYHRLRHPSCRLYDNSLENSLSITKKILLKISVYHDLPESVAYP